MNDFFLILHILGAAAWLGGGFLTGFVGPRMGRQGTDASIGWARVSAEAGTKFFNTAGIVTVLSGIGLVVVSEVYDWADTFVSIGFGIAIATGLIAALALRPGSKRLIAAFESGQPGEAVTQAKRAAIWGTVSAGLLIVAVVVMVLKTGAG